MNGGRHATETLAETLEELTGEIRSLAERLAALEIEHRPPPTEILTVPQFAAKHPTFSVGRLRRLVFGRENNGLTESGALLWRGRLLLLDEAAFLRWFHRFSFSDPLRSSRSVPVARRGRPSHRVGRHR